MLAEVEKLKKKILALAAVVEDRVIKAVKAVVSCDSGLAQQLVDSDVEIDHAEVEIEEDCLKLLALYQPVAADLRFIITVLKVNNDLERIGDLAVNIAERALFLCARPPVPPPFGLSEMQTEALAMLKKSLDALMKQDVKLAREVRASDDKVDAINRDIYKRISEAIRANPDHTERLLNHLSVSRYLERIADHATNVAEDVLYLVEGEIVRHRPFPT